MKPAMEDIERAKARRESWKDPAAFGERWKPSSAIANHQPNKTTSKRSRKPSTHVRKAMGTGAARRQCDELLYPEEPHRNLKRARMATPTEYESSVSSSTIEASLSTKKSVISGKSATISALAALTDEKLEFEDSPRRVKIKPRREQQKRNACVTNNLDEVPKAESMGHEKVEFVATQHGRAEATEKRTVEMFKIEATDYQTLGIHPAPPGAWYEEIDLGNPSKINVFEMEELFFSTIRSEEDDTSGERGRKRALRRLMDGYKPQKYLELARTPDVPRPDKPLSLPHVKELRRLFNLHRAWRRHGRRHSAHGPY